MLDDVVNTNMQDAVRMGAIVNLILVMDVLILIGVNIYDYHKDDDDSKVLIVDHDVVNVITENVTMVIGVDVVVNDI